MSPLLDCGVFAWINQLKPQVPLTLQQYVVFQYLIKIVEAFHLSVNLRFHLIIDLIFIKNRDRKQYRKSCNVQLLLNKLSISNLQNLNYCPPRRGILQHSQLARINQLEPRILKKISTSMYDISNQRFFVLNALLCFFFKYL